jgi:hypothetical protein
MRSSWCLIVKHDRTARSSGILIAPQVAARNTSPRDARRANPDRARRDLLGAGAAAAARGPQAHLPEVRGPSPRRVATDARWTRRHVSALGQWPESSLFDGPERAALRCVDQIHAVALSDVAFAELERAMGPAATVELVLLASFYEAVARIIQALGLEVEPAYEAYLRNPPPPGGLR